MRFCNRHHRHYCGIDLHVKTMYVCILDAAGQVLLHRNVPSTPEAFVQTVASDRDDLVVAAECGLADFRITSSEQLSARTIFGGGSRNTDTPYNRLFPAVPSETRATAAFLAGRAG